MVLNVLDKAWFSLKKCDSVFSLSLEDILICVRFAESCAETAEIPDGWWDKVSLPEEYSFFQPEYLRANGIPDRARILPDVERDDEYGAEETLWFFLQTADGIVKIGLSDVLLCLKLAQKQGVVPKIHWTWWIKMSAAYPKLAEIHE